METLHINDHEEKNSPNNKLADSTTVYRLTTGQDTHISTDTADPNNVLNENNSFIYTYELGPTTTDDILTQNGYPSSEQSFSQLQQETEQKKKTRKTWVNYIGDEMKMALAQGTIPIYLLEELNSRKNYFQKLSYFKNHVKPALTELNDTDRQPINYWGGLPADIKQRLDSQQSQDAQQYAAGWTRIASVLAFIDETELSPKDRQIIYELYETGELPYDIAMDNQENSYQASPREFINRITPYLQPYRVETIRQELAILLTDNQVYQERYGNITHTIVNLFIEGRIPHNFTLLPLEQFDELVTAGIKNHDIDHFDYIYRANRIMNGATPQEKTKIFQRLSNDPAYNINSRDFERQKCVERAFKKVKGSFLERISVRLFDNSISRRFRHY